MSTLELERLATRELTGLDLRLGAGCWPVLGGPRDGAAGLIAVAAGWQAPRRGRVRLDGQEPLRAPAVRRRIGTLLGEEPPIFARNVGETLTQVTALRGDRLAPDAVLGPAGISGWASRRIDALSLGERRAVALALAFSIEEPLLLALEEPLSVSGIDAAWTLERMLAAARGGAVVLVTTASPVDAARIAPSAFVLGRGRLHPATPLAAVPARLRVRSPQARQLCALVAENPGVAATEWDAERTPGELLVSGNDVSALAVAIAQAARAGVIQVTAVSAEPRAGGAGVGR